MAIVERQVFPALLVAALATACVLAVVVLTPNQHALELESDKAERAEERGFFDSLAAKDKAKGVVESAARGNPAVSAAQERQADDEYFVKLARQQHALKGKMLDEKKGKLVKGKPAQARGHVSAADKRKAVQANHAVKSEHKNSMHHAFVKAKEELAKEKKKMQHMEEHDKIKEAEQKFQLERMTAHHQADEYERHLEKLNDKVFPTDIADLTGSKHATSFVKNALVDNMDAKPVKKVVQKPVHKAAAVHKGK